MSQYLVTVQRKNQIVIEAPSTEEAATIAKAMVSNDPNMKLLGVVRTDLLEEPLPQGAIA